MLRFLRSATAILFATTATYAQPTAEIDSLLLANSNAVVRNLSIAFDYHSPTSGSARYTEVVTILNANGVQAGAFVCSTDNTRQLKSFSGELIDQWGKVVRKFKRSDLKYTEYSGSSLATDGGTYYVETHNPTYPYTVKYQSEFAYKDLLGFPTFMPASTREISVEQADYTISAPAGTQIVYKNINTTEPEQNTANGKDIYRWRIERQPAVKAEKWSPPTAELISSVQAAPREFTYAGTHGSLANWTGFGTWLSELLNGRDMLPEALKTEIHRRTDHITSPREKVRILYDYLGETTRYVSIQLGIGGWQPMSAEEVYRTKFGDCKALTNYLRTMLCECGIESEYTIIRVQSPRMFCDFASFTQADHAILRVPLEDETLWLECTNTEVPFGYVHNNIAGHDAVIIRNGTGEFTTLPQYADTLNRLMQHVYVTLAADGSARGRITERYEAAQYEQMMSFAKKEPKKQTDYLLSDLRKIPMISIDSISCREEKTALPVIEVAYTFNAPKYGNISGSRCFVPQSPFSNNSAAEKSNRLYDIYYPTGYLDQLVITLHIPADMRIESMPKPMNMETPFGNFSAEITFEKGLVTIDQRTMIRAGRYSRDNYEAYRKFIDDRAKTFNANLVLRKEQ